MHEQSSGYGAAAPRQKLFEPQTNRQRAGRKAGLPSLFLSSSRRADPGLVLSRSEPDLSQREGGVGVRARWSVGSSPAGETEKSGRVWPLLGPPYPAAAAPPTRPAGSCRVWEGDCTARSCLALGPGGRQWAVSGARHSIALLGPGTTTDCSLVGHAGPVTGLDWARGGDWLASSGEDAVVKIWDWRSRRVIMDVNSRRGGFYEEGYGVARKVSKEAAVFTESVTRSRFFYMDNILLSASGNKLVVHSLKLPVRPGEPGHFRLAKTFPLADCKTVTTLSCANQFFSFLTLLACSDRSVRVFDVNAGREVREVAAAHPRPVYTIQQNEGALGCAHPERGYDLFITAALGDGAKVQSDKTDVGLSHARNITML